MDTNTVIITALGIVATCVGGLVWILKYMFENIMPMLEKINESIGKNTEATRSNDEYLRKRNGRDNEMHAQVLKGLRAIEEAMK